MTPMNPPPEPTPPKRCIESVPAHSQGVAILFQADDGRSHSLSTAQFLHLTVGPNPDDPSEREHSPELAQLVFGSGLVEVRGAGLGILHERIAAGILGSLSTVPPRYRGTLKSFPFIHSIRVTLTQEP